MELKNYFAQDAEGNAQPSAACYLYNADTTNLVNGLVDAANQPLTNPFVSDSYGLIQFKAPNGIYDLRVISGNRDYKIRVQAADVTELIDSIDEAVAAADTATTAAELSQSKADIAATAATNAVDARDDAESYAVDVLTSVTEVNNNRILAQQAVLDAGNAAETKVQQLEVKLANPVSGANNIAYKNPRISGITGADSMDVTRKLSETVSLYDFGAKGGGVDDSTAIYDALTWLYSGDNRNLIIPSGGTFRAPQKLELLVSGLRRNCHISGYGSTLLLEDTGGIKVYVTGTSLFSELSVKGLRTNGGGTAFEFLAGDSLNFIYNASVEDCDFSGYKESGLVMSGNVFESSIRDQSCSSLAATGYGVHLRNQGTGIISSIDIWGGTTRGGKHGLFVEAPVNDLRVFGGTYLMAKNEGVRIDNAIGASVFGTHVEMNWSSAGSLSSGGAGLHMSGRGEIHGVFGANSPTTYQQYVLSVYANDIMVTGGGAVGTYTKYGKYQQSVAGNLTLIGDASASYDAVGEVFPTMIGSLIKSKKISKTENFKAYAASISIDLNRGNFIRVATLAGDVVIGNPTNRAVVNGEEITVELKQDSVGARTATWGSDFATGITPIDTTPFKGSIWTFIWSGNKWKQTGFAATL